MHIVMTACASKMGEVKHSSVRACNRFAAFVAGYSHMPARQRESCLLVLGESHIRRLESRPRVALLASVAPWVTRKLALVRVLVAIRAERELHLVTSFFPCREVAGFALNPCVRNNQWKGGSGVVGHAESRGMKSLDRVATLTASSFGALCKLATMWIGLVAVSALRVRNRPLEVAFQMAGEAGHVNVLPQERIAGLRVIELRFERRLFPCCGCMTRLAALLELAFMRVCVAIGAVSKLDLRIARPPIAACNVTFFAGRLFVHAGERIARLRMIETRGHDLRLLPVCRGVALRAARSEPALVRIQMASRALSRKAHPGAAKILR